MKKLPFIPQRATLLSLSLFILLSCCSLSVFGQKQRKVIVNGKKVTHISRAKVENRNIPCGLSEFRRIDGTCNNLTAPERYEWGAADIELAREMDSQYGLPDDYNDMAGQDRPSPRAVSNLIVAQGEDLPSGADLSAFVFTWGQFLDHDIDLTPEGHTEYAPIALPANEPLFTYDIPFFRSEVRAGTGIDDARQQSNLITSWIDASNVYGSEISRADWLRTFQDGKLKTSTGNLLPYNTIDGEYTSAIDPDAPSMAGDDEGTVVTYVAGDIRAAEQPGLTSLHTLFVREHNRICDELYRSGERNDEQVYQLARKHVGALIQAITYEEFLPALGINVSNNQQYVADAWPNIRNVFATAAYRLGHTMVTEELLLRDNNCRPVGAGEVSLVDAFFNPTLLQAYDIDPILKGLSMQVQQEVDTKIIDNLRNFLFALQGQPGTFGLDLAALNIQRGRDHGLPDYNTIRAHYLGAPVTAFYEINEEQDIRQALRRTYDDDINQIDPWVGLLAEEHLPGSSLGPTLHAILKKQFEALRDGDFYYYERDPYLNRRTRDEVRNTSLSDVIERNTSLNSLSNNVFEARECGFNGGGGRPGGGRPGGGGGRNLTTNPNTSGTLTNSSTTANNALAEGILHVYPNPSNGVITLALTQSDLQAAEVYIEDLQGRILIKLSNADLDGRLDLQADLSHWVSGLYIVSVKTAEKTYSQKLVLEKR